MKQEISPIQVRPWTLNGISDRMLVSHYDNNYAAGLPTPSPEARRADRDGFRHAPRALLREPRRRRQQDPRPDPRRARGTLRQPGSVAPGIRRRGSVTGRWRRLGAAHVLAEPRAV